MNRFICSLIFLAQTHINLRKCPPTCESALFLKFPTLEQSASHHISSENTTAPGLLRVSMKRSFTLSLYEHICQTNGLWSNPQLLIRRAQTPVPPLSRSGCQVVKRVTNVYTYVYIYTQLTAREARAQRLLMRRHPPSPLRRPP